MSEKAVGSVQKLKNEILACCNSIGYTDKEQKYIKDPECQICLKECIRFLRRDKNFVARKLLGFANIVTNDLIPLFKQHCVEDETLFDIVLRLLVSLTNPTLLMFKEQIPEDKEEQKVYLELTAYLYTYKAAFSIDVKLYSVLAKHMARILQLNWENKHEEHRIMLERILILIRNVLHVPVDPNYEHGTDEDANVHDLCIETMHKSGINDLLLFMANSDSETEFCFHILEILSLMLREQNAEFLAKSVNVNALDETHNKRNFFEKQKDSDSLKELLVKDRSLAKLKNSTNFNRFKEATYLITNMKSLSDKDVIFHKTPSNLNLVTFGSQKQRARKAKNRAPLVDETAATHINSEHFVHRSTFKIRKFLRDFCSSFLMDSYNEVMKVARNHLERKKSQANDETYYLWTCQFFMEFCRCMNFDPQNVAETLSIESFHYLHTLVENYMDLLSQEKKHFHACSRRLHFALKTYRELLFTLSTLDKCSNPMFRKLGDSIKSRIFYEVDYRELLLRLIHAYNPIKSSPSYLRDLIETNHIFLKMLEKYCKINEKVIVKQNERRKQKKKSGSKNNSGSVELLWTEVSIQVTEALQGSIQLPTADDCPDVIPIDGTSDKSMDDQKLSVMGRIHFMMKNRKVCEAVALYRNAREAWSDDPENAFGSPGITFEDELMNLRDIVFDDFLAEMNPDTKIHEENDDNAIVDEAQPATTEKEFIFLDFIKKYMNQKVFIAFSSLLQNFEQNSAFTNHCIIKMFHRAAWDNKMHAMFFQLSVFKLFQKVLNLPSLDSEEVNEIAKFAKYILQRFFEATKKNKIIFAEILFWKNAKEAYEVEEGYGTYETSRAKSTKEGKRHKKKGSLSVTSSDDEKEREEDRQNEQFEFVEREQGIQVEFEQQTENISNNQQSEHTEQQKDTLLGVEDEEDDEDFALLNEQLKSRENSDEKVNILRRKRIFEDSASDDENQLIINEDEIVKNSTDSQSDNENFGKEEVQKNSETIKRSNSDDEEEDEIMNILRRKRAKFFESESDSE